MLMPTIRLVLLLAAVNLLLAGGLLYGQDAQENRGVPRPAQLIDRIQRKIDLLDAEYIAKLRRSDAREARRVIAEIEGLLDGLAAAITYSVPPPMADADFSTLLGTIRRQPFESEQIKTLLLAARYGWFSCAQVITVLHIFTFSSGKFSALEALWPRVTDRANSYRIIESFTFSIDKDKAAEILTR